MIKAVIFDLDGTLIQTEVLKAQSYALAISQLAQHEITEQTVLDCFNEYVGLSRQEVVAGLAMRFKDVLSRHLNTNDLEQIGQQLINKRLEEYRKILDDSKLLAKHFCSYTLGLFHQLLEDGFQVVLATMSHLPEAKKVTETMGIFNKFHHVFTRDDVLEGKPAPDIYNLARATLKLAPKECLVIEDSVNGIRAAQNAHMPVFAVTNSITRRAVHDCQLLEASFIVDDLTSLQTRVYHYINTVTS